MGNEIFEEIKRKYKKSNKYMLYVSYEDIGTLLNLIEKQSKEIEELKASHITTNNKATNTEKAKIFDVIDNSIDTYIEKSKPYWEQIMTKDEMTIDEALTIIDDMYQDKYKIMEQKTDTGVTIDLSKMGEITFTNLEFASIIVLREIQSLRHKIREFIKNELPDDEIMKCCSNYDVNGVRLRKELQKLLEE